MIDLLSQSLSELLKPALGETRILFDPPSETFKPERTSLNLFLYDIRENLELRSNEPRIEPRAPGRVAIHRPPFRIACSYLITAWAVGGSEPPLQEQRLLAQALAVLLRYPTIPAALLEGGLKGQAPPLPMVIAQADGLKAPHEFWTAIGNKLRPSITATVTIALEPGEPQAEVAPLVQIHDIRLVDRISPSKQGLKPATAPDRFRIEGRVTDKDGKPVPEAGVTVLEAGITARTDADGRYTLGLIGAGAYTLRVQAGGAVENTALTLPPALNRNIQNTELDVELP